MHKNTISSMRVLIPRPSSLKQHLDAELQLSFTTQVGRQLRPSLQCRRFARTCPKLKDIGILAGTVAYSRRKSQCKSPF
ncbi:hypothetical protein M3J09_008222 [Ascochyta lentis]